MSEHWGGYDPGDGPLRDEISELRAEIERLRGELAREKEEHDRCTTFHAIAVKERNYERVLVFRRDAEIERLRGLLRWHLNWMHDDHSDEEMEKWDDYMEDWEKRVREALGDD